LTTVNNRRGEGIPRIRITKDANEDHLDRNQCTAMHHGSRGRALSFAPRPSSGRLALTSALPVKAVSPSILGDAPRNGFQRQGGQNHQKMPVPFPWSPLTATCICPPPQGGWTSGTRRTTRRRRRGRRSTAWRGTTDGRRTAEGTKGIARPLAPPAPHCAPPPSHTVDGARGNSVTEGAVGVPASARPAVRHRLRGIPGGPAPPPPPGVRVRITPPRVEGGRYPWRGGPGEPTHPPSSRLKKTRMGACGLGYERGAALALVVNRTIPSPSQRDPRGGRRTRTRKGVPAAK